MTKLATDSRRKVVMLSKKGGFQPMRNQGSPRRRGHSHVKDLPVSSSKEL